MTFLTYGFLSVLLIANPIRITYINEFIIAPDSLEQIEIAEKPRGTIIDVRGWQITTSAGLATVNNTVLPDTYVVINQDNVTGPFGLADSAGRIIIRYRTNPAANETLNYSYGWPKPFASGSRFNQSFTLPPEDFQVIRTYIDTTPTMGRANDDYGSITGLVKDQNNVPIENALVEARGPLDQENKTTWYSPYAGRYYLHGMTRCKYWMRASKTGYSPDVHPDSVNIGEVVDFTLRLISVDENEPVRSGVTSKKIPTLYARNFPLIGEPGTRFEIYNVSGYRLSRFQDLRNLTSGIYFLVTTNKGETKSHKIVFIK